MKLKDKYIIIDCWESNNPIVFDELVIRVAIKYGLFKRFNNSFKDDKESHEFYTSKWYPKIVGFLNNAKGDIFNFEKNLCYLNKTKKQVLFEGVYKDNKLPEYVVNNDHYFCINDDLTVYEIGSEKDIVGFLVSEVTTEQAKMGGTHKIVYLYDKFKKKRKCYVKSPYKRSKPITIRKAHGIEQNEKCNYCNSIHIEVHHIKPVSCGGSQLKDRDNLMLLCEKCHQKVHEAGGYFTHSKVNRSENKKRSVSECKDLIFKKRK